MRNEGDLLRPGIYADVKFHLTHSNPPLIIPASALILRSGPPRVATVGPTIRYGSSSYTWGETMVPLWRWWEA